MPVMVPAEVLPSPQVMMAVYDAAVPNGSALVNVATEPLNGAPAVGLKLTPVANKVSGLITRLVLPALGPKPVVPAPYGMPLYEAVMVWLPAFSVGEAERGLAVGINRQRGAERRVAVHERDGADRHRASSVRDAGRVGDRLAVGRACRAVDGGRRHELVHQHADGGVDVGKVRHGQVGLAVAVEVADRHGLQGSSRPRSSEAVWNVPSPLPSSTLHPVP